MKLWECIKIKCPACDAEVNQRCQPLKAPYKVRSTQKAPHVLRIRAYRRFLRQKNLDDTRTPA